MNYQLIYSWEHIRKNHALKKKNQISSYVEVGRQVISNKMATRHLGENTIFSLRKKKQQHFWYFYILICSRTKK